ncbi:3-oxoacid CoA-transferase [Flavilitoribacter nigricans]|uniref:Succinyl-CoA--3-ketoacid-CoA transferase n=1 Tax=Flavilitoribacter nigricans (strain ATCC 23147 / DSM 23189 / NBRC 102662 / NCIMB 1420 / SS-2) TaxID=1122177 RepID=A0A2D0N5Z6_FLAN2|nr:3-oxoacid CoA-transferase [Flavilitoribacter nigricans]PHN03193.1 succinyl-CoA--3-ketoacid-CoA transferase [Flavilitoribacter nigricans DSM 23189 = NBRC 102662]
MKDVPVISIEAAVAKVKDGDTLLCGGFGMTGNPVHLLNALAETDKKELTYVGNNVGEPSLGGGRLLLNGQIKKMIGSYFTSNPDAVKAAQSGQVAYELLPQGSLSEAIRAGGMGIGGFYTPTAVGTVLADDREVRRLNGVDQVFVPAIRGNVAFIRAWKADTAGNLTYRLTEQNFNTAMAMAADLVIAEVEEIVPAGELDPNHIHTQACFVDFLVEAKLKEEDLGSSASVKSSLKKVSDTRMNIARRAFRELEHGNVVNLGIGIPTLIADLIKPEDGIIMHTENGMLGVGPEPEDGSGAMKNPVNAGKIPVTALDGASYFDSTTSFGMIRGRHVDVAIMGGLQVDSRGNLANWAVPGKPLLGVGGAMDLASGARKLIITMRHLNRDGSAKIVEECDLPLTALQAVDVVITDLAVFVFEDGALVLRELMPGATLEQVRAGTTATFREDLV